MRLICAPADLSDGSDLADDARRITAECGHVVWIGRKEFELLCADVTMTAICGDCEGGESALMAAFIRAVLPMEGKG